MAGILNLERKLRNLSTPVRVERLDNGTILVRQQPEFRFDRHEGYLYLPDSVAPSNYLYLQSEEYESCTKPNPVYARLISWFFEDRGRKASLPITQVTILPYDDFLKTMINDPKFGEGADRVIRMPFSQMTLYSNRDYLVKKLIEDSMPKEARGDSGSHLAWIDQSRLTNGNSNGGSSGNGMTPPSNPPSNDNGNGNSSGM